MSTGHLAAPSCISRHARLAATMAAAALLGSLALAVPAGAGVASDLTFAGSSSCADGSIVITWTGTKTSSQLSFEAEITSATVSGTTSEGTLEAPVTFSPNPLPRLGADVTTATFEVGGSLTGTYVLDVDYVVTPFEGSPSERTGSATVVVEGACAAPTTLLPTTSAESTTSIAPRSTSTTAAPAAAAVRAPAFTG